MTPFYTDNFEIDIKQGVPIPNDYLILISDQQFKNKLTYLMFIRNYGIERSTELSLLIKNLINDITNEIVRLRN